MDLILENYKKAFERSMKAKEAEVQIKDEVKKAHNALLVARDELRAYERQVLSDTLILN